MFESSIENGLDGKILQLLAAKSKFQKNLSFGAIKNPQSAIRNPKFGSTDTGGKPLWHKFLFIDGSRYNIYNLNLIEAKIMGMTSQKIISIVQTFPISVQEEIVETLQKNLRKALSSTPTEDEIEQILLAKGLISEIPKRSKDKEEANYTPVELNGKPLSETILEERE